MPRRKTRLAEVVHMQHVSTVTHALDRTAADPAAQRIARNCLMTRARQTSRVATSVYDDALRPFGIVAQQFSLLVFISEFGPISRSDLGRRNHTSDRRCRGACSLRSRRAGSPMMSTQAMVEAARSRSRVKARHCSKALQAHGQRHRAMQRDCLEKPVPIS